MDRSKEHENYLKESSELLKEVPEEFHEAIQHMAWENGHSYGYYEVLNYINEYVHALKKPIEQFRLDVIEATKRMV